MLPTHVWVPPKWYISRSHVNLAEKSFSNGLDDRRRLHEWSCTWARFWKKYGIVSSAQGDGGKACYGLERMIAKQKWWCNGIKQSPLCLISQKWVTYLYLQGSLRKKPFSVFHNGRVTMIIGLSSPQWLSESRGQHLLRSYSVFREQMKWHTSFTGFWKVANCSLGSICSLKVPRKPAGVVIHPLRIISYISAYRWSLYFFKQMLIEYS